jgi:uncharacterized protein YigE (DUF2233 family)
MKKTFIYLLFMSFAILVNQRILGQNAELNINSEQLYPKNKSNKNSTDKITRSNLKDTQKIKIDSILSIKKEKEKEIELVKEKIEEKKIVKEKDKEIINEKEEQKEEVFQAENEKFTNGLQKIIDKNYKDIQESLSQLDEIKTDSLKLVSFKVEIDQLHNLIEKDSISLIEALKASYSKETNPTSTVKKINLTYKKLIELGYQEIAYQNKRLQIEKIESSINNLEKIKANEAKSEFKSDLTKLFSSKDTIRDFQCVWNENSFKLTIADFKKIKLNKENNENELANDGEYLIINNKFTPALLKSDAIKKGIKSEEILYSVAGKITQTNEINDLKLDNYFLTWYDKSSNYVLTLSSSHINSQKLEAFIEHFGGNELILTKSNIMPHISNIKEEKNNVFLNQSIKSIERHLLDLAKVDQDLKDQKSDLIQRKKEAENFNQKIAELEEEIITDLTKEIGVEGDRKNKIKPSKDLLIKIYSAAYKITSNKSKLNPKIIEFKTFKNAGNSNIKPSSLNKAILSLESQFANYLNSEENLPLLVPLQFGYSKYRVVIIDPTKNDIHLHNNGTGDLAPLLDSWQYFFKDKKIKPYAIMNAGMYEINGTAKGLLIESKIQKHQIDLLDKGSGNFYMQPNGIFYQDIKGKFGILDTKTFNLKYEAPKGKKTQESNTLNFATQSGPMLVKNNIINSQFFINSANTNIRNGVGITTKWKRPLVVMVISDTKVNFYEFAFLFKSVLGCENALYLDGAISKMYVKGEKNRDLRGELGPKLLVTEKK